MKKIFFVLTILPIFFCSCVSTSKTFGVSQNTSFSDVRVVVDDFTGQKTYEYLSRAYAYDGSPTSGLSADGLKIIPHVLVSEAGVGTFSLKISYTGLREGLLSTAADKSYQKLIFLKDTTRLILNLNKPLVPSLDRSGYTSQGYKSQSYKSQGVYYITEEQYKTIMTFFENSKKMQCAMYSTDNVAVKIAGKTYPNVISRIYECAKTSNPDILYNQLSSDITIELK